MANKLLTIDEMVKFVRQSMKKHKIEELYNKASKKDKALIARAFANLFGGRFPK